MRRNCITHSLFIFLLANLCAGFPAALQIAPSFSPPLSHRPKHSKRQTLSERLRSVKDLFHQIHPELRPTYIVLVFATFTSIIHRVTTQSMLPLYATSQLGLTPKEVGLVFTISGLSVFAMILPAGFVIDKVG